MLIQALLMLLKVLAHTRMLLPNLLPTNNFRHFTGRAKFFMFFN
jgi:hypothetical protein